MENLNVFSIFRSISGECGIIPQGTITTFIRLAGCNLRCLYCDTEKAWERNSGQEMTIDEVVDKVEDLDSDHVLITGGEPLLQQEGLTNLCMDPHIIFNDGMSITIETNGSITPGEELVKYVDSWVVDYKLPGSEEMDRMLPLHEYSHFPRNRTLMKFVCSNEQDLLVAVDVMEKLEMCGCVVSAARPLTEADLLELMIKNDIRAVLNVQIHKYIFPEGEVGDVGKDR